MRALSDGRFYATIPDDLIRALSPSTTKEFLSLMGIEGKIALITGASSGIGESIALALGRKGARLTLVARREGRLRELAARIEAEGGPAPFVQSADLRQESGILHLFEASTEHWGGLDILVNNAGLGRFASWH